MKHLSLMTLIITNFKIIKAMKKHLFLFCCIFSFCISAFAVDPPKASYRCKLPGTYDYVTIDYYNEGKGEGSIVFCNQSNMPIVRMHVKVEVTDEWYETEKNPQNYRESRKVLKKKTVVLCDDVFTDIPYNRSERRTNSSRGPIKGGNERDDHTYTYTVTVIDDPICSPL